MVTLPPDDWVAWEKQLAAWGLAWPFRGWELTSPPFWVVTGVHPERRVRLVGWLRQSGQEVRVIESSKELPLRVQLEHPNKAGMDRLLDAVAANARRHRGRAAVIVDAGSAVTVDLVDKTGGFRGGAIMPGLRLMAEALHDYTSLLPRIEVPHTAPAVPGTSTTTAMQAGVFWSVVGGIRALLREYEVACHEPDVFLTGGDAPLLAPALGLECWPEMTLEGIRLTSESLP
jgi:type III pantothenate kinase